MYVHLWEEGNVSFTAKVRFYEWESFILFLRTDCTSYQTGRANFHIYLKINVRILTQSLVLEMLPKKVGKLRHVL